MMLRDLSLGFIKLHILHHAGQEPVYGLWLIEELGHRYKLSPGDPLSDAAWPGAGTLVGQQEKASAMAKCASIIASRHLAELPCARRKTNSLNSSTNSMRGGQSADFFFGRTCAG